MSKLCLAMIDENKLNLHLRNRLADFFCINKVLYQWNRLSSQFVNVNTIDGFKRKIDIFTDEDER